MVFQLDPAFEEGAAGRSFLVTAEPEELLNVELATIQRALADGYSVIYVLTLHPYKPIMDRLPTGPDADNLHVIDCISREINVDEVDGTSVTYLDGPGQLNELVARLGHVLQRFDQDPVVLIMDSVRGILGYNTEDAVAAFLQTLTEKADMFDMRFKLFKSSRDLPQYEETIEHLFSDRIHVSEETAPYVLREGRGLSVRIPSSIADHLSWENGARLEADLVDEETLELRPER